jgi:hypothetical protein
MRSAATVRRLRRRDMAIRAGPIEQEVKGGCDVTQLYETRVTFTESSY